MIEFNNYLKDFLSEVLWHIEQGHTLKQTKEKFSLPRYRDFAGYKQFMKANIDRAYKDLKETVVSP